MGGMLLGHTTVCAVEIEEYPRKVLLQRQRDGILPKFPIWDDVTTFDGKPWRGKVDVVCGGFPCQDISAAGKGAGIEGKRSGLWSEFARIIGEVRPRYAFVENSPMLVGRGLAVVLGDLAEMGYDARWCILGADDIGAPHRRKRIWILALANLQHGFGRPEPQQPAGDSRQSRDQSSRRGFEDMADRICAGLEGHAGHEPNRHQPGRLNAEQDRSTGARGLCRWWQNDPAEVSDPECAGLEGQAGTECESTRIIPAAGCGGGCKDRGQTQPRLGRVAYGVAHRVDRLKAIGNGQVSIVAATAWELLAENDRAELIGEQTQD